MVKYSYKVAKGSGGFDYDDLAGRTLTVQYMGIRRGEDGHIFFERLLEWDYKLDESTGQVVTKDTGEVVKDLAYAYTNYVWYTFRIVRVNNKTHEQDLDPHRFFGQTLRHRMKTHGLRVPAPGEFVWHLKGRTTALIGATIAAGFNVTLADNDEGNDYYDPGYVYPLLEQIPSPLSEPKLVEYVFDPLLMAAAHPPDAGVPWLLKGEMQADKGFFIWDSFSPLSPDLCALEWQQVKDKGLLTKVVETPPEAQAPMPGETPAAPPDIGLTRKEISDKIAAAVMSPESVQGHAVPKDRTTDKERLAWLHDELSKIEPGIGTGSMLTACQEGSLTKLYAVVFPKNLKTDTGAMSL